MKKSIKKLVLSRETLRKIQEGELAAAPGAATGACTAWGASRCTPCYTNETVSPCVCS
jgi:hypothetical protein